MKKIFILYLIINLKIYLFGNDGRYMLEIISSEAETNISILTLEYINGRWQPIFAGWPPLIRGVIHQALHTNNGWEIKTSILRGEPGRKREWHKSNMVLIDYNLKFYNIDDKLFGTWETNNDKGKLTGKILPLANQKLPPQLPPGVHPRFLFRKEDLSLLKAKMQTEWGQKFLKLLEEPGWSRSGTAVAQGLLYQLTGDEKYAIRAKQLINEDIYSGWWKPIGPIHDPAHKATEAIIAYDLIHDTYSENEHIRMKDFLRSQLRFLFNYADINSGNGHPHSNWSAQYRSALGMVALALLADPSYSLPHFDDWIPPEVNPPEKIDTDAPVLHITNCPLRKWLYTGPLNIGINYDPSPALTGSVFKIFVKAKPREDEVSGKFPYPILFKNARPRPLNKNVLGDDLQPLTEPIIVKYKPIPERILVNNKDTENSENWGMINLWRATELQSFQTLFFRAIIENPKTQYIQIKLTDKGKNDDWKYPLSYLYISGRRFEQSDIILLKAGCHPVVRQVTIGQPTSAHNRHLLFDEVWLVPVSTDIVEQAKITKNNEQKFYRIAREVIYKYHEKSTVPDIEALVWLAVARCYMERYANFAISEKGWHCAGQCYTQHPLLIAFPFFHCWRNAMGTEVTATQNLGWFLGQAVARTVFNDEWVRMQDYGRGGGPIGVDLFSRGFSSTPPSIRGAVFSAWQKTIKLTEIKKFKCAEGAVEKWDPVSAAFAFVNWPCETVENIELPKAIIDTQRLGYTMRNRYQDGDDIVAVFTGFHHPGGDWRCEGAALDLRLQGLGIEWITGGISPKVVNRVIISGDDNEPLDIKQKYCSSAIDGSAIISLEYNYGLRCVAVDYSLSAKVPALIAIVDKITSYPKKVKISGLNPTENFNTNYWQLVTDINNDIIITSSGFIIKGTNDATLNFTVIKPQFPQITVNEEKYWIEINYRFDHAYAPFTKKVIRIPGSNEFFVIMTLQKGTPPKILLEGNIIHVGEQTIRFDGEKIVLEKFKTLN